MAQSREMTGKRRCQVHGQPWGWRVAGNVAGLVDRWTRGLDRCTRDYGQDTALGLLAVEARKDLGRGQGHRKQGGWAHVGSEGKPGLQLTPASWVWSWAHTHPPWPPAALCLDPSGSPQPLPLEVHWAGGPSYGSCPEDGGQRAAAGSTSPSPAKPPTAHSRDTASAVAQPRDQRDKYTNEGERGRRGPPCNLLFRARVGPALRMVRAPPTWGRACTTVSSRARMPVAIFSSFSTRAGS